ncbi:ABC transporter permease [Natrinema halophilum]|uniref:ABC transporter permease n=1 Tax=Natrinema halophilum TaxID=1699371 RepID=A0A7D5GI61_9EURY|nr:ABC transporter permease [Natrinema halophilum]QLG49628.1 ABC transporter permease [Natrinema halophilum]
MSADVGTAPDETKRGSASSSINPVSVRAVARKDFQDSIRSWLFWGLSAFFFLLLVIAAGILSSLGRDVTAQVSMFDVIVFWLIRITKIIVPLIALILGWKSIAGERESGSIKILLSLPHSRKDVILGKLLGRSAVLTVSLTVGFALAAVPIAAILGTFDVANYVGLLVMSIIYGVAYTSIAVSLSSLTPSTTIAGAGIISVFFLFYGVWNGLLGTFQLLGQRDILFFDTVTYTREIQGQEVLAERPPNWAYFIRAIDPGEAYINGLRLLTDVDLIENIVAFNAQLFGGEYPFYLTDWFSVLILLFWIVVPTAVALYRFDRVDI